MTLLAIVQALEDIADDLSTGTHVEAFHAIQDLSGRVLDDMRGGLVDHRSMAAYRPIHELNTSLHRMRKSLLEKRAKAEAWRYRWEDSTFIVEDPDSGVYLTVDGSDNWTLSTNGTPDFLISDCGLLTMLAAFNGTTLAHEASRLTHWLDENEARR